MGLVGCNGRRRTWLTKAMGHERDKVRVCNMIMMIRSTRRCICMAGRDWVALGASIQA